MEGIIGYLFGLALGLTTITLILEDGTKIIVPIQNVIITGQQKGE